jgi:hypothetical protein
MCSSVKLGRIYIVCNVLYTACLGDGVKSVDPEISLRACSGVIYYWWRLPLRRTRVLQSTAIHQDTKIDTNSIYERKKRCNSMHYHQSSKHHSSGCMPDMSRLRSALSHNKLEHPIYVPERHIHPSVTSDALALHAQVINMVHATRDPNMFSASA